MILVIVIILFLLATLVAYYLFRYQQIHSYFKQRGVRFLPGVPVFGNMFKSTFLKGHFVEELNEVYNAYPDDKYVGFIEFTSPLLMIRDPELIKNITVKDFDHFVDHRPVFSKESDPLFGGSLFLMKGDKWRDMRSTLSPAFTSSKMKHTMPFIMDITNNIIKYLREHLSEDVDAGDLLRRYTNDVIASAGFGLQVNSVKDRDNESYMIGRNILDFNFKQRIYFVLIKQFPTLVKKLGIRIFSDKTQKFFTNMVATIMEYRMKSNVKRPDMIQLLMDTSKEWTADELSGQVFLFFLAGFESSASALVMSIHELALNPKTQEKLYQEIRKHKEDKELNFYNLSELKYLECVINETLRKWSTANVLDRLCVKSYELPPPREGGRPYSLKPGDIVLNMVNCLHTDPKYFPEPEVFNPDRFSEENKHNIHPFTFTPFGAGPRGCIGTRFAYMEIKIILYHLILNFKILKCEKTTDPIRLQPHRFNTKSAGGTWVKFEEREPEDKKILIKNTTSITKFSVLDIDETSAFSIGHSELTL